MDISGAEALKAQANAAFGKGKYNAAINLYTEAIISVGLSPPAPYVSFLSTLHSNRALCHKALNQWEGVESDASKAESLDRFNAKAQYLLGLCQLRKEDFDAGLRSLEKGLDKAERKKDTSEALVKDFQSAIAKGRAQQAEAKVASQRKADADLQAYLRELLAKQNSIEDTSLRIAQLEALFADRERARSAREPPEHLLCPISFELMLDPVVTIYGHTYERAQIERYVDKKCEDPTSRKPLSRAQLAPNHALRAVITSWLESNPWAHPAIPYTSSVYDEIAAQGSQEKGGQPADN